MRGSSLPDGRFARKARPRGRPVHRDVRRRGERWGPATSIRAMDASAPIIVSTDPMLLGDLHRLCAAAGVVPEVVHGAEQALRHWAGAPVVLVGADSAAAVAASSPPRRARVHVLGRAPVADALFRDAL